MAEESEIHGITHRAVLSVFGARALKCPQYESQVVFLAEIPNGSPYCPYDVWLGTEYLGRVALHSTDQYGQQAENFREMWDYEPHSKLAMLMIHNEGGA